MENEKKKMNEVLGHIFKIPLKNDIFLFLLQRDKL